MLVPLVIGASEMFWQSIAGVALEGAAMEASRQGSLGRKTADGKRAGPACPSDIIRAALAASGGILSRDRLTLTPTQYGSATAFTTRSGGTTGTGTAGSLVEYRLAYRQKFLVVGETLFGKSEFTHVITTTVVNEPYPNASSSTACPS